MSKVANLHKGTMSAGICTDKIDIQPGYLKPDIWQATLQMGEGSPGARDDQRHLSRLLLGNGARHDEPIRGCAELNL